MRNRILIGIVIALAAVAAIYFATQQNATSGAPDRFAIKNTDKIHKIMIATRDGKTFNLTRGSGKWLLDEKYKVRKAAMKTLLETTSKMQVLYIPPKAAYENVMRDVANNGILVRYFDKAGKKIKGYQIAGASADGQGTHILMEGEDQPYIVHIPIWEGILTPRFLTREEDWRDRAVIAVEYKDIKSVQIEYPNLKSASFKLEENGGKYTVEPLFPTTPRINKPVLQGAVQKYLIGFRRLEAEAIKNGLEQEAGITNQMPFAILTLTKKNGDAKTVTFYPIAETFSKEQGVMPTNPTLSTEKYFATVGTDFLLIQQLVFGKVFMGYGGFFEME